MMASSNPIHESLWCLKPTTRPADVRSSLDDRSAASARKNAATSIYNHLEILIKSLPIPPAYQGDVANEVMCKLLIPQGNLSPISSESGAISYLYVMLRNTWLDMQRKGTVKYEVLSQHDINREEFSAEQNSLYDPGDSPQDHLEKASQEQLIPHIWDCFERFLVWCVQDKKSDKKENFHRSCHELKQLALEEITTQKLIDEELQKDDSTGEHQEKCKKAADRIYQRHKNTRKTLQDSLLKAYALQEQKDSDNPTPLPQEPLFNQEELSWISYVVLWLKGRK